MWLVFGLIVVVAGCWLAVTGVQAFTDTMTSLQGKAPGPAKSMDRSPEAVLDVQADYRERCRKGMTKQELRWIIGDFQKARLDEGPGSLTAEIQEIFDRSGGYAAWGKRDDEDPLPISPIQVAELKSKALQLAKAQQDWYVDALADALRLDDVQITRAKESGREFIAGKTEDFLKYGHAVAMKNSGPPGSGGVIDLSNGQFEGVGYIFPESGLLVAEHWLAEPANPPWKRCELRPEQLALTNHRIAAAQHGEQAAYWLVAPEILAAKGAELDFPNHFMGEVACILPLTAEQGFPRDENGEALEDDLPKAVTKLHPAQFKLLLLCDPDLAEELLPLLGKE
jgi:hypothetical protein